MLCFRNIDFRIKTKFETNPTLRGGRETARHIIESNNIVTDVKKANVEIILGLRKLGGQILKSDPPSQSEIIERAALKNEEVRKRRRSATTEGNGSKSDVSKKSATLPILSVGLPRKMSLGK